MSKTYKLGSRSSPLAVKQVEEITASLKVVHPEIVLSPVFFDTAGDIDKKTPLSDTEGTDFFTDTIEKALMDKKIDLAVHSAKDLPDSLPESLIIAAITKSIDSCDVLVAGSDTVKGLEDLPFGARIGTSSKRRKEQLQRFRGDFKIEDIRGNIGERLQVLGERGLDGIVIAAAGMLRLGLQERITQRIPFNIITPHPLQGALALEVRASDKELISLLQPLNGDTTSK
ncbi:MAG: hydroxymethylbilane synthase [Candidatus Firestonebacteria bacterium RIFOXYC2_FULL_39_67]|nr:MAG: hydroxymethylbilane synthase [Candidatus Firestonebacteria bacterium RIFOXYC2_FULL_39_67]